MSAAPSMQALRGEHDREREAAINPMCLSIPTPPIRGPSNPSVHLGEREVKANKVFPAWGLKIG